jgi:hypothetical protein
MMLSIHHTGIEAFLNSFHALIGILHQQEIKQQHINLRNDLVSWF